MGISLEAHVNKKMGFLPCNLRQKFYGATCRVIKKSLYNAQNTGNLLIYLSNIRKLGEAHRYPPGYQQNLWMRNVSRNAAMACILPTPKIGLFLKQ